MNFYLVERTDKWSYDDYDSFVCVAENEEQARWMTPDPEYHMWKDGIRCFSYGEQKPAPLDFSSWCKDPVKNLKVTLLNPTEPKVILSSFNAG